MKLKPFIRWAGGKQKIINEILQNIPNPNDVNCYYEPFLGAGSLFFESNYENSVLSDINPQLINSYKQIRDNCRKLSNILTTYEGNFSKDKNFYYSIRDKYNNDKEILNIDQAARFIFLIHTNYNGMYRINKSGNYNVPIGKIKPSLPKFDLLSAISDKLANITLNTGSYTYLENTVVQNDFIYLDPPYPPFDWSKHQRQYTVNHFSNQNHIELSTFANELRNLNCFVMLSYPDIEFVREIYSDWNIIKLNAFRSISCKKERKIIPELIIKNY
jgi:DNA adenine methylase